MLTAPVGGVASCALRIDVFDDGREAIGIGRDLHSGEIARDRDRGLPRLRARHGRLHRGLEVHRPARALRLPALQLLDEARHAFRGIADGADGVIEEHRVVPVALRVGD